ncbi:hypothetical protein [Egicoccus sp. AB-alg2]|uniref:hypothetical protein n=1 Tax=Egicoccus sp. AB-alg2 TaxID=3242693 RepID=UPI00359DDC46
MGTATAEATVETRAAVLSARCAVLLRTIARQGGPEPDDHLAQVRRLLARRARHVGRTRRRQLRAALYSAERGRPHPVPAEDVATLVRDLEMIEHVLRHVARVGANAPLAAAVPA